MPLPNIVAGLRKRLHAARGIAGELGLRPYTVDIVDASWVGPYVGRGDETTHTRRLLENGQNPRVRFLNDEELALGQLPGGTVEIGPITPAHGPGGASGTPREALQSPDGGQTLHVVITGPSYPNGAKFAVVQVSDDHALHYTLRAKPVMKHEPEP